MHEIQIADRVLREARGAGARKFFRVEVGELCEISKEELEQGLNTLIFPTVVDSLQDFGGTVLQNSGEVDFEEMKFGVDFIQSLIKCKCNYVGKANISERGHGYCIWECPECGLSGKNVEVIKGGEIKVVEVE